MLKALWCKLFHRSSIVMIGYKDSHTYTYKCFECDREFTEKHGVRYR